MNHYWPKAVRDAIRRPLFAILLGKHIASKNQLIPQSTADLVEHLVSRAFTASKIDVAALEPFLERLATLVTDREAPVVPVRELHDVHSAGVLQQTGLIINDGRTIGFSLPILAEWFAARALVSGSPSISEVISETQRADRWRFPLAIAVATCLSRRADEIMEPLAVSEPALASWVLDKGVAQWGFDESVAPPPPLEAGRSIWKAMRAWVEGVRPVAPAIAPLKSNGSLRPLGVSVQGPWLTSAWYRGVSDVPEISDLGPVDWFHMPVGWSGSQSARTGASQAWSWRWTHDKLRQQLSEFLRHRRLPTGVGQLRAEEMWAAALAVSGSAARSTHPISLSMLEERLSFLPEGLARAVDAPEPLLKGPHDLTGLRKEIAALRERGLDSLEPPYPAPEALHAPGVWIPGTSGPDLVLRRTMSVYLAAATGYPAFVLRWFPKFRHRFRHAAVLPARIVGYVCPPDPRDKHGLPTMSYTFWPLSIGETTQVHFELSAQNRFWEDLDRDRQALAERTRAVRRSASSWLFPPVVTSHIDHVFRHFPALELVHDWLRLDLRDVHWLR
jgi:hypothetical protein